MRRSIQASRPMLTAACILLIVLATAALSASGLNVTAASTTTTKAGAAVATTVGAKAATTAAKAAAANATTGKKIPPAVVTAAAATAASTTMAPSVTTQAAVTTQAMRKPRRQCLFPFWYHGQWFHECLNYGSKGARWCSLTQNFTRDEEWRECTSRDVMRFKCAIPFRYQGKEYSECQPLLEPMAHPTFWCALVPTLAAVTWQSSDWAFCEAPNATNGDYVKAVGRYRSLEEAAKFIAPLDLHGNVVAAAAASASKSLSAGDSSSGPSGADSRPSSALGIVLGIVGVVLAAVAVLSVFAVHRRNQYKRIDPLLSAEPAEKTGSYGGMQAYHD